MIMNLDALKPIPNSEQQTCFGCGAHNPHGLKMQFFTDGRQVYSFMQVPPAMTGWDQTVHGGVLSTMLDEIMGWAVIALLKKIGMTRSITVDFIQSVNTEEKLTIVGGIQETPSERSALVTGAIYKADDSLCVKGAGQFTTMQPKAALRLGLVSREYLKMFQPVLALDFDR
jgi:acyl-coenzyme A thioesterase PaaI-like protein